MAKSKAKKHREKLEREGYRNPEQNRSEFATSDMYKFMKTKKTKTKRDKMHKRKHKGGYQIPNDNDPFYVPKFTTGSNLLRNFTKFAEFLCILQKINQTPINRAWFH